MADNDELTDELTDGQRINETNESDGGFGARLVRLFGGVTRSELAREVQELTQAASLRGYEAGYYDGMNGNDDPAAGDIKAGGFGYRTTRRRGLRAFDKVPPLKRLDVAWNLWQVSPIATRIIKLKRGYIIGKEAPPVAENEELQAILSAFHKRNKLHKRGREFVGQLFGFGEQCFTIHVRNSDGAIRLGYIDPLNIRDVITDPRNDMDRRMVIVETEIEETGPGKKKTAGSGLKVYRVMGETNADGLAALVGRSIGDNFNGRSYYITHKQAAELPDKPNMDGRIDEWEREKLEELGADSYAGDVMFFTVGNVSNQARGVSIFIQIADWIDQCDNVLFSLAERENFSSFFSFDVTLEGADDTKVKNRSKEIRMNPPRKGSVNVHNDKETWQMWAPSLGQGGSIETFRALLGFILGGVGIPVHWFGFGDDANRATAVAQGAPTEKTLEEDQDDAREMLTAVYQAARDQAIIAGGWVPKNEDPLDFYLNMPPVSQKDTGAAVSLMGPLAQALLGAVQAGWITNETAGRAWAALMTTYGITYEIMEEMSKAAQAAADQEEEQAAAENAELSDRLAASRLFQFARNAGEFSPKPAGGGFAR